MNLRHSDAAKGPAPKDTPDADIAPQIIEVDGAKQVYELIVWLIRNCGYRAIAAANVAFARSLLARRCPVVVTSDLEIPYCEGWGLLAFCHPKHPHVPVIVVSRAVMETRLQFQRSPSAFLRKSFGAAQFQNEFRRLICQATARL